MSLDDAAAILLLDGRDKRMTAAAKDDRSSPLWRVLEWQQGHSFLLLERHQHLATDFEMRPASAGVGTQPQLQFIAKKCGRRLGNLTDVIHGLLRHNHLHRETHPIAAIRTTAMKNGADISGSLAATDSRRGVHEWTRRESAEEPDCVKKIGFPHTIDSGNAGKWPKSKVHSD